MGDVNDISVQILPDPNDERQHVLDETCWCTPQFRQGFLVHQDPEMPQDAQ